MSKRVLILKFGAIGDVVMALPGVCLLHQMGMQVDWVCGRAAAPLLQCYSWVNVLPVDDRAILQGSLGARLAGIGGLWRMLVATKYELCATLYYDERYKVLSLPVRAKRRVMLSRTDRADMLIPGRSHASEYARVLLGSEDAYNSHSLIPVRPDRLPMTGPLPETSRKRVALVPAGASNMMRQQTLRRWPVENYVATAQELLARGWEVVLLGGPDDVWVRPYFEQIAITDCIGTLSLPEVILACDQCDGVISHDTGPLHLAGLSEAVVVGIFGPTDPGNFLPRRDGVTGIWGGANLACRPCYDGRNFAACAHNGCMHEVTTGLVLREMDGLLERRALGLPSPVRVVVPGS